MKDDANTSSGGSARQRLLEDVLGEYMQRLDRGESVDREQFLAQHPGLAEELLSYFAGVDEVDHLTRTVRRGPVLVSRPGTGAVGQGSRVGDYELLEQIGAGGMGIIYKARHVSLGRLVALKMIRPDRLDR